MINNFLKILLLLALYQSSINAEIIKLTKEGGTYSVPVTVNDAIRLNFIVDSGASDVTIPYDVFSTLRRTGTITQKDILEEKKYEMANGSIEKYYTFNIRQLKIGNQTIYNIQAAASKHMDGALLLGQSALKKLEPWGLDTSKDIIYIKEKSGLPNNVKQNKSKKSTYQMTLEEREQLERNIENVPSVSSKKIKNIINLLKTSCNNGDYKKCTLLAEYYTRGEEEWGLNIKQDLPKAVKLYNKACSGGYANACSGLASMYNAGKGVKKNERKALKFNQKACVGGDVVSCHMVGLEYTFGILLKKDNKKAVKLFKKVCKDGYVMGCSALGDMYRYGKGVKKDSFKAVKLFKRACDSNQLGNAEGCIYLAFMYYEGNGVRQSNKKAKEFLGKACDSGDSYGCEMYAKINK